MNLHGKTFRVTATAAQGVVNKHTRLDFAQCDQRVLGRYMGGTIVRGCLVGTLAGSSLSFKYAQREADGHIHGGRSVCSLQVSRAGRLRLVERFVWDTRVGSGVNVFEEVDP
jgi:hypothetical protein